MHCHFIKNAILLTHQKLSWKEVEDSLDDLYMKVKVRFGWFNWDFLKVGDETASW